MTNLTADELKKLKCIERKTCRMAELKDIRRVSTSHSRTHLIRCHGPRSCSLKLMSPFALFIEFWRKNMTRRRRPRFKQNIILAPTYSDFCWQNVFWLTKVCRTELFLWMPHEVCDSLAICSTIRHSHSTQQESNAKDSRVHSILVSFSRSQNFVRTDSQKGYFISFSEKKNEILLQTYVIRSCDVKTLLRHFLHVFHISRRRYVTDEELLGGGV